MKNGTKNYRTVKSKQITFSFKLQCNLNTLKNFLKNYIPLRFASRQNLGQSCDLKLWHKYYNMVLQKSGKTADISRRHTTCHPAKCLLRNERRLHTDDASVGTSGFVRRKSQPVKDTSSVLNFCARSDFIGCLRSCTDFSSVLRPGINHFSCRVPRPRQLLTLGSHNRQ